ncbi:MAG TPA: hypothetical protein V6C76_07975 [Drouetiella sp.]
MFKVVLACLLTIACSSVSEAKQSKSQIAQANAGGAAGSGVQSTPAPNSAAVPSTTSATSPAAEEPSLRGSLPVSGTPSVVSPSTSVDSHPIPPAPTRDGQTTTTSTTTTTDTTNVGGPLTDALGNPLTPGQPSPIPATASINDLAVTARSIEACPLPRDFDQGLKYVEVTVKNTGQNIAVILGNSAHAAVNSANQPTAPASDAEDSDLPRLNGKGRLAVGLVSAFSFGYCGPIFYEVLTPEQHRKRYLGTAIGRDGSRHDVEDGHFGIRVIMPGDETVGWMAFRCNREDAVKALDLPISFTRSAIPAGTISVPVASAVSK